jgi:hypothetical protein
MVLLDDRIILGTFLTLAAALFAVRAVQEEVETGEPAVRGLVHAAIGGLFVLLTVYRHPLARAFALYAMFGVAVAVQSDELSFVLALAVVEVAASDHQWVVPEAIYALAVLVVALDVGEDAPYLFHVAFLCALGAQPGSKAIFALSCSTLAIHQAFHDAPTLAVMLCLSAARAAVHQKEEDAAAQDEGIVFNPHWAYVACTVVYGAALWVDASVQGTGTVVMQLTRFVHVAAVLAALLAVLPAWMHAYPWLRAAIAGFPLVDAALCAYRGDDALWRGGSAVLIFGALAFLPFVRVEFIGLAHRSSLRASRPALGAYALVHAAYAAQLARVEDAVGIVFHHLVVTLSVAALALEWGDASCRRIALVFTTCEATAATQLLVYHGWSWELAGFAGTTAALAVCLLHSKPRRELTCFFKPV